MTELEKCMSGMYYNCHEKVFLEFKETAKRFLSEYNNLSYSQKNRKKEILEKLLGRIGENVSVGAPFLCDYGCNIYLGDNVSINMNCTFVDCNKIEVGNNVMIASNVQIYTATHPIELKERLTNDWTLDSGKHFCQVYALPVKIGSGCWIGGGVIILPGVTIGEGSVIGAGSVVVKDIPENCLAVGNPCKVIRKINGESRND